MYAKSTIPSAKREVQKERSANCDFQKFRSAQRAAREARDENVPARRADFFYCSTIFFPIKNVVFVENYYSAYFLLF